MTMKFTVFALSIVSTAQALAQSGKPTDDLMLEEVVITAEHREASLQKTEISLTAMTADTIQDLGLSNGTDLGQYVPNVTVTPMSGSTMGYGLNIRGVGQNETIITFDPSAGMYVDDVLIPKSPGALLDVADMERIEVLRGPQGTLYGRNTIAGAINYITKKPTDRFEGNFRVTLGTANQQDYKAMLNVPLLAADSGLGALNFRVTSGYLTRDGFVKNILAGAPTPEFETKDRKVGAAQLQWEPTDALTVRYKYDITRIDEVPETQYISTTNPNSAIGRSVAPYSVQQNKRPTTLVAFGPMKAELEVDGHALDVAYDLAEAMTVRSITGYRETWSGGVNTSAVPFRLIDTSTDQTDKSFTQEFRLVGTTLADRLDYSTGLFYMDEDGNTANGVYIFGNPSITSAEFSNSDWAVYGQATYALTEKLSLTGGLRYTEQKREMTKRESAAPNTIFPTASDTFDHLSPLVSVGYQWNEDINTYFKISDGWQAGGFNVRDTAPVAFATGFKEETLTAYELGIKATSPDKRIRTNVAFWFSDYKDKRVNNFDPQTLSNTIRNAGAAQIYGMELEFLANLTKQLQVGLDYGYTNPKYTEYDDGRGNDLSKTSSFPYTPENNGHIFANYALPRMGFGALTARVDWSYRDTITFLTALPERNSGRIVQLWNARLTLDQIAGPGDTTFQVSAWGKNLTDESYWDNGVNIFSTFGFDLNLYGDPRTYGVDFEIAF